MTFDALWWASIGWPTASAVLTSAIVTAAFQGFVKGRSDSSLATLTASLARKNSIELERWKSELSHENSLNLERLKQRFSLVSVRQVEAIETAYKNLADTHSALLQLVSPGRFGGEAPDNELWQKVHDSRWAGKDHIRASRIYLPRVLGAEVDAIYDRIGTAEMKFRYSIKGSGSRPHDWEKQDDLWREANGEIAAALRELEDRFRSLLVGEPALSLPPLGTEEPS